MRCIIEGYEHRPELHFNFSPPVILKEELMKIDGVERVAESKYCFKIKLGPAFNADDILTSIKNYIEDTFDGIEILDNISA